MSIINLLRAYGSFSELPPYGFIITYVKQFFNPWDEFFVNLLNLERVVLRNFPSVHLYKCGTVPPCAVIAT